MNDTNLFSLTSSPSVLPSFFGPELPYSGPKELLAASELSIVEKRKILSSWASDARAVPDAPALRMVDNGQAVTIQEILEALKTLDELRLRADDAQVKEFVHDMIAIRRLSSCRRSFAAIAGMTPATPRPARP